MTTLDRLGRNTNLKPIENLWKFVKSDVAEEQPSSTEAPRETVMEGRKGSFTRLKGSSFDLEALKLTNHYLPQLITDFNHF